ncbi:EAL domain-containing protein [Vibrio sp. ZSDE26]|uniref:EAL domain-containing protein n=1 Tax=Vibrio amylolyticus TaxID=2847292 RepID=A0A9X1XQ42_9VIBR|nr:EAL domain-containing protein [Vibrio amylolyticus]MCK6265108.1 EAL domain-containing protein [Vibrio amylolyticus]
MNVMKGSDSKVETKKSLGKIYRTLAVQIQAIREGLLWILPCLMISSLLLFVGSVSEFIIGPNQPWVEMCYLIYHYLNDLFPILLTAALSYILAMHWRLPRPPVALISIVYLAIFNRLFQGTQSGEVVELVISVVTPLYSIPLLAVLFRHRFFQIVSSNHIGQIVRESLNLILPSILVGLTVISLNSAVVIAFDTANLLSFMEVNYDESPLSFGVIFTAVNSLLWFIGIHGYYALLPWISILEQAIPLAQHNAMLGEITDYAVNFSFMGAFVFVGGSGATLGLVLSLLLFSKQKPLRLIALASLPLGLLNINEILLFGLPIIFNPRLFIPFILAPVLNLFIAYMTISLGYVSVPITALPFSSPILFNSWLVTGGDTNAPLLQMINIVASLLVYSPFVLAMNRDNYEKTIQFNSLDTVYSRRKEEALVLKSDRVVAARSIRQRQVGLEQKLEVISRKEFCLEYQPQICANTHQVTGCEALIRAIDAQGNKEYPGSFLPWFEKAGMMMDIDRWAVIQVVSDVKKARSQGWALKTSVNITPETLLNHALVEELCRHIAPVGKYINIEITEESLLKDHRSIQKSINAFREVGASIYIDDFGSGFSSLGYLSLYDIDAIKIDRSFALALDKEKGRKVFHGLLGVAEELELATVIEGVETKEQINHIPRKNGVSIQGWYYSKSLPYDNLQAYIVNQNKNKVFEVADTLLRSERNEGNKVKKGQVEARLSE